MADVTLLPCPFCGSPAAADRVETLWKVACDTDTHCLAAVTWGMFATEEQAAFAWNTRAHSATPSVDGEVVQRAAECLMDEMEAAMKEREPKLSQRPWRETLDINPDKDGEWAIVLRMTRAALGVASPSPRPLPSREEVETLIQAVERYAFERGYAEGQDDAQAGDDDVNPSTSLFLCGMRVARECDPEEPGARLLALLEGGERA